MRVGPPCRKLWLKHCARHAPARNNPTASHVEPRHWGYICYRAKEMVLVPRIAQIEEEEQTSLSPVGQKLCTAAAPLFLSELSTEACRAQLCVVSDFRLLCFTHVSCCAVLRSIVSLQNRLAWHHLEWVLLRDVRVAALRAMPMWQSFLS